MMRPSGTATPRAAFVPVLSPEVSLTDMLDVAAGVVGDVPVVSEVLVVLEERVVPVVSDDCISTICGAMILGTTDALISYFIVDLSVLFQGQF